MYMIVETCGKQYKVQEGDLLKVESLGLEEGANVVFDKVLLVGKDDATVVGAPYVEGASVSASVKQNGRDPKIIVFKYKSKKNYRRKKGHRQHFSEIRIDSLNFGG
ncbi:MAG: 50S ribosomal protein L21 [Synergistaceae bacterium]|nr:50S ribosomal protein L21 [Synergistaceae bacterium]